MKAQELRIGNWVYEIEDAIQVEVVDISNLYYNDFNDGTIIYTPIPLTEEWLVKFGFEKGTYNNYVKVVVEDKNRFFTQHHSLDWDDDDKCWYYSDDESNASCHRVRDVTCVHSLQNLYFALIGKELI